MMTGNDVKRLLDKMTEQQRDRVVFSVWYDTGYVNDILDSMPMDEELTPEQKDRFDNMSDDKKAELLKDAARRHESRDDEYDDSFDRYTEAELREYIING